MLFVGRFCSDFGCVICSSTAFRWLLLLPNNCLGRVEEYFEGHAHVRFLLGDSSRVERS
jgi:hypothetical protein